MSQFACKSSCFKKPFSLSLYMQSHCDWSSVIEACLWCKGSVSSAGQVKGGAVFFFFNRMSNRLSSALSKSLIFFLSFYPVSCFLLWRFAHFLFLLLFTYLPLSFIYILSRISFSFSSSTPIQTRVVLYWDAPWELG